MSLFTYIHCVAYYNGEFGPTKGAADLPNAEGSRRAAESKAPNTLPTTHNARETGNRDNQTLSLAGSNVPGIELS